KANVGTISGTSDLMEGSVMASFLLSNGTQMRITNAIYILQSLEKNLLSFKDICLNGYHIETINENDKYIYITGNAFGRKQILEKLPKLSSGIYIMKIRAIEFHNVMD
ncbi:LOW QUALITY PROTEIN: hypothetical protein CFOL_v3_09175, partial [Cephalotus follicularis]